MLSKFVCKVGDLGAAAVLGLSAPAWAASFSTSQMLKDFTMISLGDMSGGPHLEGTGYVGGNATLDGGYYANSDNLDEATINGQTGGFFVGGDLNGSGDMNHAGNGDIIVGGSANINTYEPTTTGADLPVAEIANAFRSLSSTLASTPQTPGTSVDTSDFNDLDIISASTATDAAVVEVIYGPEGFLSYGNLNSKFGSLNKSITTVVNIPGEIVDIYVNLDNVLYSNLILNFYDADTVTFHSGLGVTVLAPNATVTVAGGGSKGTVVGGEIIQSAEIRPYDEGNNFTGDLSEFEEEIGEVSPVPLPATGPLLIAGLGGLAAWRRRAMRRKAA